MSWLLALWAFALTLASGWLITAHTLARTEWSGLAAFAASFAIVFVVPMLWAARTLGRSKSGAPARISLAIFAAYNAVVLAVLLVAFSGPSRSALVAHGARPLPDAVQPAAQAALERWLGPAPEAPIAASDPPPLPDAGALDDAGSAEAVSAAEGTPAPLSMTARQIFAERVASVVLIKIQREQGLDALISDRPASKGSKKSKRTKASERVWLDGAGSGFLVSEDGLFVTNHHVLGEAGRALVLTHDGRRFDNVEVLVDDATNDLVLGRIVGTGLSFTSISDRAVAVGEPAYAIGSPLGLEFSITQGIVSQVREVEGTKVVQMQTDIAPGSSGGPLFDERGKVIGVNTAVRWPGLNYAVHYEHVRALLDAPRKPKLLPAHVPGVEVSDVRYEGLTPSLVDRMHARSVLQALAQQVDGCIDALPDEAAYVDLRVEEPTIASNVGRETIRCLQDSAWVRLGALYLTRGLDESGKPIRLVTSASGFRVSKDRKVELRVSRGLPEASSATTAAARP